MVRHKLQAREEQLRTLKSLSFTLRDMLLNLYLMKLINPKYEIEW